MRGVGALPIGVMGNGCCFWRTEAAGVLESSENSLGVRSASFAYYIHF